MKVDEFMYDYSLEYLTYMVEKYVEENFERQDNEEKSYHASDIL